MVVVDSIFPVFGLIFLGTALKRIRLTSDTFLSTADRLVYFVFFPLMLFWKIGGAGSIGVDGALVAACTGALLAIYTASWIGIRLLPVDAYQAGSFSQSCYRFNTYIGMAVVINALGEEAAGVFGILIGIMIPIINLLAVATLIWYSDKTVAARHRKHVLTRAILSNPLIIGCAAGMLYAHTFRGFPVFVDNTLRLAGYLTLPLALLSIGGNLTFSNFREYIKPSLAAAAIKLLALPAAGFVFLQLFGVSGTSRQVAMIYFALPTSTAIFVLSSQLNSDIRLASAAIVTSTLLGVVSLTLALTVIS